MAQNKSSAVWKKVSDETTEGNPGPRSSHSISFCDNRLFVYGGEKKARETLNNDIYSFNLAENKWSSTPSALPSRLGHATVVVGNTLFIHGGRNNEKTELQDMWSFDVVSGSWAEVNQGDVKPPGRSYHAMTAHTNKIYIFGGCGGGGRWDDLWEFDLDTKTWTQLPTAPSQRGGPVLASATPNGEPKLILIYGFNGKEMDDLWEYSISKKEWKQLEGKGQVPEPRSVHAGCTFQDSVFIFGGEGAPSGVGHEGAGNHFKNSFLYNTTTQEWIELNSINGPSPRGWMVATSIPNGAAIFGGLNDNNERINELYLCEIK